MSADEIAQRVARTKDFLTSLDANHNGMIDANEASDPNAKGMLDRIFGRIGKEPHYPISISEITQGYEAYYRSRGSQGGGVPPSPSSAPQGSASPSVSWTSPPGMGFGTPASPPSGSAFSIRPAAPSYFSPPAANVATVPPVGVGGPAQGSAAPPTPSAADAKSVPRKPAHFPTSRERLPKGLPDWFLEKDVNGEGQITMAAFTTNWTPAEVERFNKYDLNHDGIITAAECLKVEKASSSR